MSLCARNRVLLYGFEIKVFSAQSGLLDQEISNADLCLQHFVFHITERMDLTA